MPDTLTFPVCRHAPRNLLLNADQPIRQKRVNVFCANATLSIQKDVNVLIRDAQEADLEGILHIYNDAVRNSTAIWNDSPVDLESRRRWLAERQEQGNPVLVALGDDGQVAGYASYGPWRPHEGFRHTVEHSVYVRQGQRGSGVGRGLMHVLIQRARDSGRHVMVGAIESENRASIHMHQQLGFTHVGQMRQVGCKFGRWLDLTLVQLILHTERRAP